MRLHTTIASLALVLPLAACGEQGEEGGNDPATAQSTGGGKGANALTQGGAEGAGHEHEAQHGGLLVSLARYDDYAWAEIVFDPEVGAMDLYLYGEHAEEPVRASQTGIGMEIRTGEANFLVEAQAVADALTGETVGDTSHFLVEDDRLRGVTEFEAKIKRVQVLGQIFDEPRFSWPVDRYAGVEEGREGSDLGGGARDGD